jgi:dihydroorotate dehydrogenase electron transfer subunit
MTQAQPRAAGPCQASCSLATIVDHRQVAEATYRIRLACPEAATGAVPGQFVMVRLPGRDDPLLARPLAIYDTYAMTDPSCPEGIDLIYLVHGRFTRALRHAAPGTQLSLWGPLGNGFTPPEADHLVLVAGGIGQTALLTLGKARLRGQGRNAAERVTLLWGARHAGMFADAEDFREAGIEVHLATLDGSAGLHGTVLDLLTARSSAEPDAFRPEHVAIACCGPERMMEAVSGWSGDRGIPCQVSLETPMACGIGICFTCVAAVKEPGGGWDYRRTCIEGPVFDARQIEWHPGA